MKSKGVAIVLTLFIISSCSINNQSPDIKESIIHLFENHNYSVNVEYSRIVEENERPAGEPGSTLRFWKDIAEAENQAEYINYKKYEMDNNKFHFHSLSYRAAFDFDISKYDVSDIELSFYNNIIKEQKSEMEYYLECLEEGPTLLQYRETDGVWSAKVRCSGQTAYIDGYYLMFIRPYDRVLNEFFERILNGEATPIYKGNGLYVINNEPNPHVKSYSIRVTSDTIEVSYRVTSNNTYQNIKHTFGKINNSSVTLPVVK